MAEWRHLVQRFISGRTDHWRVKDGWSVLDKDLKSVDFQSHIPGGWFCLMNDLYWGEGVKRSMSLLSFDGVCMCYGGSYFHLAPDAVANTFDGVVYQTGISSAALVYCQYSATDGHLCTNVLLWRPKMPQMCPKHCYCLDFVSLMKHSWEDFTKQKCRTIHCLLWYIMQEMHFEKTKSKCPLQLFGK